ncbi:hypothetical protein EV644_106431 [Kribbella orskensis]|uniref:Uncharacterized protein n=1 Tax=Kribbella orskensis TaxID=2512216 RepID=A0ABY2BKQ0_9ACTN|nr:MULTISPECIES: hypothetical protein [Kribbella]TCN40502.1 hypothetical protein EV642_105431 [Kribbella sp. VKM Ac-2500]TCO23122.1 hypothetical protein EV644_106431 [Kribbella orskensis]
MASPVEVQLLLCDAAVSDPSGKIHMLGAGWSMTGTPTAPQAVAILIKIPWDRSNQKLPMHLQLLDSDGHPVNLGTPDNPQYVTSEGEIEVGRPPGVAPGSMLDASIAVNVQSMPLPIGRYEWRLDFAGQLFTTAFQVIQR